MMSNMAQSQVDPKSVLKILEHKEEDGEKWYKIQWKDSWVPKGRLNDCLDHIVNYLENNQRRSCEEIQEKLPTENVLEEIECSNSMTFALPKSNDKINECNDGLNEEQDNSLSNNVAVCKRKTSEVDVVDNLMKIKLPDRQQWHMKDEVKKRLLKFYDKFAKIPQEGMKAAKKKHNIYIQQLEDGLKEQKWCKKLEYTGSSYEGLKISEDGLEFDVMFLMEGKDLELVPIPSYEGYVNLKVVKNGESVFEKFKDDDGILLPKKMIEKFISVVQKILNDEKLSEKVKLRKHGPAVQMDVQNAKGEFWYSVDLVPAIVITENGERYVPKPLTEPDDDGKQLQNSWRKSFSREEKDILIGIDSNNGCRRQVVRILKALCKKESVLKQLTSYHLKTLLFHAVNPANELEMNWTDLDVTECFFDMLGLLEHFLENKNLPQYYIPSMNLFKNIKPVPLQEILNRVKVLRSNENAFLKAVSF